MVFIDLLSNGFRNSSWIAVTEQISRSYALQKVPICVVGTKDEQFSPPPLIESHSATQRYYYVVEHSTHIENISMHL